MATAPPHVDHSNDERESAVVAAMRETIRGMTRKE
jgi:hypothetical protein